MNARELRYLDRRIKQDAAETERILKEVAPNNAKPDIDRLVAEAYKHTFGKYPKGYLPQP